MSHDFAKTPEVRIPRSRFKRPFKHLTSFNAGQLVPIFWDEVLPKDTISIRHKFILRMTTPIHPVMDVAEVRVHYFWVNNRIIWPNWPAFMGENDETAWIQQDVPEHPTLIFSNRTGQVPETRQPVETGMVADYIGLPLHNGFNNAGRGDMEVSALPFRAYAKIWNEFYRDQNVDDPAFIPTTDGPTYVPPPTNIQADAAMGTTLLPVAKKHDYFTSALPGPQKGPPAILPFSGIIPVIAQSQVWSNDILQTAVGNPNGLKLVGSDGTVLSSPTLLQTGDLTGNTTQAGAGQVGGKVVIPSNLGALVDHLQLRINDFRLAFATQRILERLARSGSRYTEYLRSMYGSEAGDQVLQRPEYLGGFSQEINIQQVLQTSSTDTTSPQGNTAAYSLNIADKRVFTKSFPEHGYVIGLVSVVQNHTYQQGLNVLLTRKNRFDYYHPPLAHIGEQPIKTKELVFTSSSSVNEETFGWRPYADEYRYFPNRISGYLRSTSTHPLDSWHYGDYYDLGSSGFANVPVLSPDFIHETSAFIDRTLAIRSDGDTPVHQFIMDNAILGDYTRQMPMYSVPGLLDHF